MAHTYLALLRGINVGGRNVIRMADLRALLEELGYAEVRTYIQSGNVLFAAEDGDSQSAQARLQADLQRHVVADARVVVYDRDEYCRIVEQAPEGFGEDPDGYKYDVMYWLEDGWDAENLRAKIVREGVDQIYPAEGAVFFRRDARLLSKSKLSKIASLPEYQAVTIRNWNTTLRLLEMMS